MHSISLQPYKQAFQDFIDTQYGQRIVWAPIGFGAGIAVYFSLDFEPALGMLLSWTLALLSFCIAGFRKESPLFWPLLGGLLCLGGMSAIKIRVMQLDTQLLSREVKAATLEGTVTEVDLPLKGQGQRLTLLVDTIIDAGRQKESLEDLNKIKLVVRQDADDKAPIVPGSKITVRAGLNPPSPPLYPSGFDFQRYAYFENLSAFGFAYEAPQRVDKTVPQSLEARRYQIRKNLSESVDKSLSPALKEQRGVILALLAGDRAGVPDEDWQALRDAGLAHMLAISGLHIGLVGGLLFFVIRLILAAIPYAALHFPLKKVAAMAALAGIAFYVWLVGAPVSAQRALIMIGLGFIAVFFDRSPFSLRFVAFAAMAILLFRPESLLNAGFQLSFAAVTALIVAYQTTKSWWIGQYRQSGLFHKIWLYLAGILFSSFIAGLATAPLVLFHFNRFPLYGLPANLLASPILAFWVMPAGLIGAVGQFLGFDTGAFTAMAYGTQLLQTIANHIVSWPHAVLQVRGFPFAAFLLSLAGGIWICLIRGRLRLWGLAGFIGASAMIAGYTQPDLLVAASGKLYAARNPEGHDWALSSRVSERFTAEQWGEWLGWPSHIKPLHVRDAAFIKCDELGCVYNNGGSRVSLSNMAASLYKDCRYSSLVIAFYPTQNIFKASPDLCAKTQIYDLYDLHENGNIAVWLENTRNDDGDTHSGIKLQSVASQRPKARPWIAEHRRR